MRTRALLHLDEIEKELRPADQLGGLSDLAPVPPYWQGGDELRRLIGGDWKLGLHFNHASGHAVPIFGGPMFATLGAGVTYGHAGYRGGTDKAIKFAAGSSFDGGDGLYDVGADDDLAFVALARFTAFPTIYGNIVSKVAAAFTAGWSYVSTDGSTYGIAAGAGGGALGSALVGPGTGQTEGLCIGDWHIALGGWERGAAKIAFGTYNLRTLLVTNSPQNVMAAGASTSAATLRIGQSAWVAAPVNFEFSQFYLAHGTSAAVGVVTNLVANLGILGQFVNALPPTQEAFAGRGRSFVALSNHAFEGADVVAGETLLTRDATIQAIVKWDPSDQNAIASHSIKAAPAANWDTYVRGSEPLDGDFWIEATIPKAGDWGMLGFRRANDATENLGGFNRYIYYNQNVANQLTVWEGGTGVFSGGAASFATLDRVRVERVGNVFKYWRKPVGGAWTLFYTGVTDANTMVVSSTHLSSESWWSDVRLYTGQFPLGTPKSISWKHLVYVDVDVENERGALLARGKATSSGEYLAGDVELRAVNAESRIGEMSWCWQTPNGTLRRQVGGQFVVPDGYTLLTATRRWESPTKVILRHYVGERMLSEVESVDGEIGGGILGTTTLGCRQRGGTYPATALAMNERVGFGSSWDAGYRMNVAASPVVPMFGGANLVAVSTPTFQNPGPLDGSDLSIGFNSANDALDGGNIHDVGAGDDLLFAGTIYIDSAVACDLVDKGYAGGGGAPGYLIAQEGTAAGIGLLAAYVSDGVDVRRVEAPFLTRGWYAWMYVMSRSIAQCAIAVCKMGDPTFAPYVSRVGLTNAVGSLSNGAAFRVGDTGIYTVAGNPKMSCLYVGTGVGKAGSLLGWYNSNALAKAIVSFADMPGRFVDFFDGVIDEVRVCDYEMSPEEIAATAKRLAIHQPDGYRMMRDNMPPGAPISDDPTSRIQTDLRVLGHGLGYASAQIENMRENLMPDRAYGEVQERWERTTQRSAKPLDSLDKRRRRVLGHLGKRNGVSPPGVQESLAELFDMAADDIPVIAFDNTIADRWQALETERWLAQTNGTSTITSPGWLVQKTAGGAGAWDAGVSSSALIYGDFDLDFTCSAGGDNLVVGVSSVDVGVAETSINFGLQISFGTLFKIENGSQTNIGSVAANDRLRVRRIGQTVTYWKNSTLMSTSAVASALPVVIDISIFNINGAVTALSLHERLVSESAIFWVAKTNITTTGPGIEAFGSRLTKTGGASAWDAGASSEETIAGDGYVEAVTTETSSLRMLGLSDVDVDATELSIDFAIYLNGNVFEVYEGGVFKFTAGAASLATGDVVRIERAGAVVTYRKNGAVLYTSVVASIGGLRIDTAMFTAAGTIDGVRLYDAGVRVPITWQNVVGTRVTGDALRFSSTAANNFQWDQTNVDGVRVLMSAERPRSASGGVPFNALHVFTALDPITLPSNCEAGIVLWDWSTSPHNFLFFGLRNTGAAFQVGYQLQRSDAANTAWTVLATTSLTKHWLRLRPYSGSFAGTLAEQAYDFSWSTTGNAESQLTTQSNVIWKRYVGWWGYYVRSIGGASGGAHDIRFAESQFRNAAGTRPFYWYALRDPSLPGSPDMAGARPVAAQLAHAFTIGRACFRRSFLLDDPLCTCDGGPMGGL